MFLWCLGGVPGWCLREPPATAVTFRGFQCRVALFRVAGMALRDIQTCFVTCRRSLCVAGAMLLHRFQKVRSSFRGRRNALETSIAFLRGRRSTSDCVLFANRIVRADKVQITRRPWHFVRCDENGRKPRAKHRF